MIGVVAIAGAYLAGVGPVRLMVLVLALYAPLALIPPIALVLLWSRRSPDDRPALFCDAVAAELRAGAALGAALATAAESLGIATPEEGSASCPTAIATVEAVSRELSAIGPELRAAVEAVSRSGGPTAYLFDELGALAIARSEIAHEVRAASAPARATAWFFVLVPMSFVVVRVLTGGMDGLLNSGHQRTVAVVGALLFVVGLGLVVSIMWRAQ